VADKAYAEAKRLMNQSLATSIETQMEEELSRSLVAQVLPT